MRHQRTGKKLGRDSAHRRALYANLTAALIEHGRIKTTVTKAKAVKPIAEQMITLGRRGDIHARRQAVAFLRSKDIVHKLFTEVGPRFAERPGGYSRIVRLGPRPGDAAEMVYLELVDTPLELEVEDEAGADAEAAEAPSRRQRRDRRRGRERRTTPRGGRPRRRSRSRGRGRGRRRGRGADDEDGAAEPAAEAEAAAADDDEPPRPEGRVAAPQAVAPSADADRHDHDAGERTRRPAT